MMRVRGVVTHGLAFVLGGLLAAAVLLGGLVPGGVEAGRRYERTSVEGFGFEVAQELRPLLATGWEVERVVQSRVDSVDHVTYLLRRPAT